jgi:thiamine pyrophosphate-dependent acetolactate synthase large subunit-like protein
VAGGKALERRRVVARILKDRGDLLLVTGLGSTSWDAAAAGDHANNFYLWGGMGGAAMVGLGLALAQPKRRVLVITGDGEMLMGLGALATIAVAGPANLAVAVIDNERYGETGMQETHTGHGVDVAGMARAAGFKDARLVATATELEAAIPVLLAAPGPVFANIKVSAERPPMVLPPRDGTYLKHRFRTAVLGSAAAGA